MFTTLDAQPQEWMVGSEGVFHTVAACHFKSIEHAEYWIDKLVPKDQNGNHVKWSGGRRKEESRSQFIDNCFKHASQIDFQVSCVSTSEGEMSWFAWALYMQNRSFITQRLDSKGRNCLVFKVAEDKELQFPVLRAGYLVWYQHVVRYLSEQRNVHGMVLSDNFANDQEGPGEGKALGVAFVNFLLEQHKSVLRVSLPTNARFKSSDRLLDYFCGWINTVRNGANLPSLYQHRFSEFEVLSETFFDAAILSTNIQVFDEQGNDVTNAVKDAVVAGAANNSLKSDVAKPRTLG